MLLSHASEPASDGLQPAPLRYSRNVGNFIFFLEKNFQVKY